MATNTDVDAMLAEGRRIAESIHKQAARMSRFAGGASTMPPPQSPAAAPREPARTLAEAELHGIGAAAHNPATPSLAEQDGPAASLMRSLPLPLPGVDRAEHGGSSGAAAATTTTPGIMVGAHAAASSLGTAAAPDRAADDLFFNTKAIAARIENYAAQCMPPQEAAVVRLEVGELLARLRKPVPRFSQSIFTQIGG